MFCNEQLSLTESIERCLAKNMTDWPAYSRSYSWIDGIMKGTRKISIECKDDRKKKGIRDRFSALLTVVVNTLVKYGTQVSEYKIPTNYICVVNSETRAISLIQIIDHKQIAIL